MQVIRWTQKLLNEKCRLETIFYFLPTVFQYVPVEIGNCFWTILTNTRTKLHLSNQVCKLEYAVLENACASVEGKGNFVYSQSKVPDASCHDIRKEKKAKSSLRKQVPDVREGCNTKLDKLSTI